MPIFIICALSCAGLLTLVFTKSSVHVGKATVSIYWLPPFLGALLLPLCGLLPISEVLEGMLADGEINPIKILILFLSMTLLSVLLDEAGFFRFLTLQHRGFGGSYVCGKFRLQLVSPGELGGIFCRHSQKSLILFITHF